MREKIICKLMSLYLVPIIYFCYLLHDDEKEEKDEEKDEMIMIVMVTSPPPLPLNYKRTDF